MRWIIILAVLQLIELTGPDRQVIIVSPDEIVAMRAPRVIEHFAPGTRCLLNTVDGKGVAVQETCEQVLDKIRALEDQP